MSQQTPAAVESQVGDGPDKDMDFDLAFDEASNPAPATAVATEPEPKVDPASPAEPAPAPPAEPAPAATPAATPADDTAALKAEMEALKKELAAAKAQAPQPAPPAPPAQEPQKPAAPSEEETKAVADLKEDWPGVHKGVEVMLAQALRDQEQRIIAAVKADLAQIQGVVAPAVKSAQDAIQQEFITAIKQVHPDIDTVFPAVEAWVNKQPPKLAAAYNQILDNATAADVIALVNTYKKEQGTAPAAPAAPPDDSGRAKRLDNMEGVRQRRSGVAPVIDENDFDAAFEAASRAQA